MRNFYFSSLLYYKQERNKNLSGVNFQFLKNLKIKFLEPDYGVVRYKA